MNVRALRAALLGAAVLVTAPARAQDYPRDAEQSKVVAGNVEPAVAPLAIEKVVARSDSSGALLVVSRPLRRGRELKVLADGQPVEATALGRDTISVELPAKLQAAAMIKLVVVEGKLRTRPYELALPSRPVTSPTPGESRQQQGKPPPEPLAIEGAIVKGRELEVTLSRAPIVPASLTIEGNAVDAKRMAWVAPQRVKVILEARELGDNEQVALRVAEGSARSAPYTLMVPATARRWWVSWLLGAVALLAVGLGAAQWTLQRRAAKRRGRDRGPLSSFLAGGSGSSPTAAELDALWAMPADAGGAPAAEVPTPPAELVEALRGGRCVLVGGAGVSRAAGLPTRKEVLHHLVQALAGAESGGAPAASATGAAQPAVLAQQALSTGKYDLVAELVTTRLGPEDLHGRVRDFFAGHKPAASPLVRSLARLPFAGVISTEYDQVLEDAFKARKPTVLLPSHGAELDAAARTESFALVKLFGDLSSPEALLLSESQYRARLAEKTYFVRYVASLALSRSLLFVGASLDTVELLFTSLGLQRAEHPHFVLVPRGPDLDAYAEILGAKFGVRLIVIEPSEGMPAAAQFVEKVADACAPPGGRGVKARPDTRTFQISRISLTNIGPFREVSLDVRGGWTMLIGNNGCGKSTILKALALGLCGDDEQAVQFGRRLLNSRAQSGCIELQVGAARYRTDLVREGERVRVVSRHLTPLQHGTWVALGFPPIRGVSVHAPRGPAADGSSTPVVGDLLPLLGGSIDSRIDNLKQWIVNLDVRASGGQGASARQAARAAELLRAFFEMLKELTPGAPFEYKGVDRSTWEVLVETRDGLVPLDLLSQGMSSILGWAGTLLQRMYEIHGDAEHPEQQPALLLLDEIDAHLHPRWQQKLMPILRKRFPGLQVLATTHSPLVVAGLAKQEMVTLRRTREGILVEEAPWDLKGWRVDQILTSPVFELEGARDEETVNKVARYTELVSKLDHTPEEQRELEVLAGEIQVSLPAPESQPQVREASQMIEDALQSKLAAMPEDKKRQMVQEIRVQVQEAMTGSRRPS